MTLQLFLLNTLITTSNRIFRPSTQHHQRKTQILLTNHGITRPLRLLLRPSQSPRTNNLPLLPRMQQPALPKGRPDDLETNVRLSDMPVQRRGAQQLRV